MVPPFSGATSGLPDGSWNDWRLGIACIVPIAVSIAVMYTMMGNKVLAEFMGVYQGALGDMNKEAVEYVRGISVVKTFQQTVHTFQTFKESILRYGEFASGYARWCKKRMVAYMVFANLSFAFLIVAAMAITGGLENVTSEFISDFLFYVVFSPLVAILLVRIMYSSEDGYKVDDALSRIDGLMAMEPLPEAEDPKVPDDMTVRFEGVTFTYPGSDRPAVEAVSMTLRPGTVTALVGPSGRKEHHRQPCCPVLGSTAGQGLDRRDRPEGHLLRGPVGSGIVCVPEQHPVRDTLLNNVRLGRPDATPEHVLEALRQAQCEDIVAKLPNGLDTPIGPGGVPPSFDLRGHQILHDVEELLLPVRRDRRSGSNRMPSPIASDQLRRGLHDARQV